MTNIMSCPHPHASAVVNNTSVGHNLSHSLIISLFDYNLYFSIFYPPSRMPPVPCTRCAYYARRLVGVGNTRFGEYSE